MRFGAKTPKRATLLAERSPSAVTSEWRHEPRTDATLSCALNDGRRSSKQLIDSRHPFWKISAPVADGLQNIGSTLGRPNRISNTRLMELLFIDPPELWVKAKNDNNFFFFFFSNYHID